MAARREGRGSRLAPTRRLPGPGARRGVPAREADSRPAPGPAAESSGGRGALRGRRRGWRPLRLPPLSVDLGSLPPTRRRRVQRVKRSGLCPAPTRAIRHVLAGVCVRERRSEHGWGRSRPLGMPVQKISVIPHRRHRWDPPALSRTESLRNAPEGPRDGAFRSLGYRSYSQDPSWQLYKLLTLMPLVCGVCPTGSDPISDPRMPCSLPSPQLHVEVFFTFQEFLCIWGLGFFFKTVLKMKNYSFIRTFSLEIRNVAFFTTGSFVGVMRSRYH